jgi:hypothetical protein
MAGSIRRRISYANVMSTIAVFAALGGGAYAAVALPKNSVGSKQIKKNAVTNAKIGKNAVTGAKVKNASLTGADINLATLPKVGSAANADNAGHAANADNATNAANAANATNAGHATNADTASTLTPPEAWHVIGAPGEPGFDGGTTNFGPLGPGANTEEAAFFKDKQGIVHLKGLVNTAASGTESGILFRLPAGYRPAAQKLDVFSAWCQDGANACSNPGMATLLVLGPGVQGLSVSNPDGIIAGTSGVSISLNGIYFRAEA